MGERSINSLVTDLKELKWRAMIGNAEVVGNVAPILVSAVSYSLLLKSYLNLVHNRQTPPVNASTIQRNKFIAAKNKNLMLFSVLGPPLLMLTLNYA